MESIKDLPPIKKIATIDERLDHLKKNFPTLYK
jgi:hypothetical protein